MRDEVKAFGIRVTIVEPGAFRTEFAGDMNMRPEQSLAAYRPKKLSAMQTGFDRWRETAMATAFEDAVVLPVGG